jgi:hypothetical protein
MFTYRIELFHLPSGVSVAQCEASANSSESKHQKKRALDILNTLQKMAQKRAFVGAVIMATGASDFFSQDLEDEKPSPAPKAFPQSEAPGPASFPRAQPPAAVGGSPERVKNPFDADRGGDFVVTFGKYKGMNFLEIDPAEALRYAEFLKRPNSDGRAPSRGALDFIAAAENYAQGEVDEFLDSLRPAVEHDVP